MISNTHIADYNGICSQEYIVSNCRCSRFLSRIDFPEKDAVQTIDVITDNHIWVKNNTSQMPDFEALSNFTSCRYIRIIFYFVMFINEPVQQKQDPVFISPLFTFPF